MQYLLDRIAGRERLRILCALAFWVATYLLFMTWNQLQDQYPSAVWKMPRVLTTLWGAVLFFGFTRLADRIAGKGLRNRVFLLVAATVACIAALVLGRTVIDQLVSHALNETPAKLTSHTRFGLVWAGYFVGGALAFLTFSPALSGGKAERSEEEPLPESANENAYSDALWVSRGRETARVPVDAIDWIEAEGDYVRLHARTGGGLMRGTLTGLETTLDPQIFARVHRSAICRRSAIAAMLRKPSGAIAVRLDSGAEVPVGRRYRDSVAAVLAPAKEQQRRLSA